MKLSVVIPTHDRPRTLGALLRSLEAATPAGSEWEILVVDNATRPELLPALDAVLRRAALPIRRLVEPVPGKSRALNLAIAQARGGVLAFLDDDVIAHKDYLIGITETLEASDHAVFGGRVLPVWPSPPPRWVTGNGALQTSRGHIVVHDYGDTCRLYDESMRLPIGCNFLCRRDLLSRHGGFDVRLGPGAGNGLMGGEESDLLRRLRAAGEAILYTPLVVVDHPVDPARMTKRHFRYRYFCAGRSIPYLATTGFPTLFGKPRYLYRRLASALLDGLRARLSGHSLAAFDRELEVAELLGAIYEYHRLRARQRRERHGS